MIKNCFNKSVLTLSLLLGFLAMNAQIKVGTNPTVVNPNAILDMESTNKGMLLPRLALTSTSSFAPLTAHVAGMSVYNTATAGDVTPGYYYNDGAKWVRIFGTSAANNTTRGAENLITITNGTGATLTAMVVGVDTAQLKTFLNNKVQVTVSAPFTGNGTSASPLGLTTNNTTAQVNSLITITNGTGATLTAMTVGVDTNALKTFVTNSITNGTISGNNLTAGSLLKTTGTPIGASLKLAGYEVDTTAMKTFIANNVNKAPIKDSIGNAVTNLFNTNAITGKNVTAGSLVTLTGTPTGASVKDFGVAVDTAAMKTFVSNNITNGSISGSNLTAGSLLQTTGTPTGASLKTAGYQVDTTALKTFVTNNITNGAISGSNTTAGSLITVTNGTGASLKAMTVAADTTAMKTFIANNVNKAPIKDSIGNAVTNLFNTNAITGKNVTAGSLVTLTGTPTGASVKDFGVAVDTTALKAYLSSAGFDTTSDHWRNNGTATYTTTGFVGINDTNPYTYLVVRGPGSSNDVGHFSNSIRPTSTAFSSTLSINGGFDDSNVLTTTLNTPRIAFGTHTAQRAQIEAGRDTSSANGLDGYLSFRTRDNGTAPFILERMRIASNGNVGIGTTTPSNRLHVKGSTNPLRLEGLQVSTTSDSVLVTDGTGVIKYKSTASIVAANNTTAGSLITVTNGTGATLTNMTVAADTTAMKTFIANNVNKAPIKDSIGNAVTNLFNTNAITGKNVTAGSLVTLTGTPTGASVKDFGVAVDTTALKTFVSNSITNGSVSGNNLTAGSLLQTTGTPTGASLKAAGYQVDTTALKTFVTNNVNSGAITGKNTTAGSLVTVTNGTGASFTSMTVAVDTTAMKTFITNNVPGVTANNTTAGSLITVTNGTGATLTNMTVAADTTAMKTFIANNINKAPIKDSIGNAVTNLFSTNAITGKNVTAGSLVTLTGTPTGASVKDFGVAVDTTSLKAYLSSAGFDTTSDHWRNNGTATYTTTGFVGINDTNPYTHLVVRGNAGLSNDVGHFSNSIKSTSSAFASTVSINGGFDDSSNVTTTLNTPRIAFGTHTAQRAQIEAGRDVNSSNGLDGYLSFKTRDNGTAPFILERMRIASNGNVGIGTTTPSNRLHVKGSTNPLRLEGLQVSTTSDSVLVTDGTGVVKYKSSASIVSNALPKDSILKVVKDSFIQVMNPKLKWFYAPTISISTASLGTGLTKDLYAAYVANFSTPAVKNPGAPATIPVFSASELNYYISQFDAGVISNVSISNTGVMTYDVISTSPSDCSYVNIIFTIK